MSQVAMSTAAAVERISLSIAALYGQRVILVSDRAVLCGVETRRFNEQVNRDAARLPADFMFRLTPEESDCYCRRWLPAAMVLDTLSKKELLAHNIRGLQADFIYKSG